ncbi:MAG: hypothetical protein ACRD1W_12205 [Vicinamibacterales bacterium]
MNKPELSAPVAAVAYTSLSFVLTWPLVRGIGSDVPGDLGDSLLNMWILAWGAEHVPRLLTGSISWTGFWNGNIFHPEPLALALSEHLFGQTLQILPVYWLTGNIILCYNLLFISTFALSAFGMYLLVRDLTGNRSAAFLAGLIYGFLPYRIASVPHLQVLSSQWMPLTLFGLNRFLTTGSRSALVGGSIALVMQNWSCGYYLLYFAPFVPLFTIHRMWSLGRLRTVRTWISLSVAAVGTFVLTLPFLLPYRDAQQLFGFERPMGEVYFFSARLLSYLTASENARVYGDLLRANPRNEQELFLGFIPVLLAIISVGSALVQPESPHTHASSIASRARRAVTVLLALAAATQFLALINVMLFGGLDATIAGIRLRATTPTRLAVQFLVAFGLLLAVSKRARDEALRAARAPVIMFACMIALAVWLSFGPNYGLYGVLYDFVPGFNGVRVPARYAMIAGLFLAVLAGYGARRLCTLNSALCCAAAALILLEGAALPLEINRTWTQSEAMPPARVYPRSQAPPVYTRLASLPAGTVVTEFPFGDAGWEIRYTYYAATHWKPITNGYSGNFPLPYKERVARLQRVAANPDAAWQSLRHAGTTHVVVHRNAFANSANADMVESWLKARGATEVERFPDGDMLYSLDF